MSIKMTRKSSQSSTIMIGSESNNNHTIEQQQQVVNRRQSKDTISDGDSDKTMSKSDRKMSKDGNDSGLESLPPNIGNLTDSTSDLDTGSSDLNSDHDVDLNQSYHDVQQGIQLFFSNKFDESREYLLSRPDEMPFTHVASTIAFLYALLTLESVIIISN